MQKIMIVRFYAAHDHRLQVYELISKVNYRSGPGCFPNIVQSEQSNLRVTCTQMIGTTELVSSFVMAVRC